MTTLEKIEQIEKLLSEVKADLSSSVKAFDSGGQTPPPGPGQPGKP